MRACLISSAEGLEMRYVRCDDPLHHVKLCLLSNEVFRSVFANVPERYYTVLTQDSMFYLDLVQFFLHCR